MSPVQVSHWQAVLPKPCLTLEMALSPVVTAALAIFWRILVGTTFDKKHSLYGLKFTSLQVIKPLASAVSLSSAPGLLDAVQSVAPPAIDWIKPLPSHMDPLFEWTNNNYAVHLVVIEKPGCRPGIYIGSACGYYWGSGRLSTLPTHASQW